MEIVIGILAVALVVCVYIIVNILRKIESKDDQLLEQIDFYIELKSDIDAVYETMKQIDSKGWFEKDDETGTVFRGINDVLKTLEEKYSEENVDE